MKKPISCPNMRLLCTCCIILLLSATGSNAQTYNIFHPTDVPSASSSNDESGIECGVKFKVSQHGHITGIRYLKTSGTTGTHLGHLWTSSGVLLGEVEFTSETSSGWQVAMFENPIDIDTGVIYVASYFSPSGDYTFSGSYFSSAVTNGPLRAPANGEIGSNGLYVYSNAPLFPTSSYAASNYWVDIFFELTESSGSSWLVDGNAGTNPATDFIGTTDNKPFIVKANNKEGLRVDSSGNIVIGDTTNSIGKLYVRPATNASSAITVRGLSGQSSSTYLQDWQKSDGSSLMRVSSTGRVGIGTTSMADTSFKLFVENGIRTRKVKIDVSSWADDVFDDDYYLRSIEEVELYIRRHKHLPDVPSAKEVAANGIDIGNGQAMLLRKIEELTLYTIEQQKKISQIQDQLQQLKNQ